MTLDLLSAVGVLGDASAAIGVQPWHSTTDSAGNTYVTGHFGGTVDFESNAVQPGNADILTSRGGTDIYVAKYAPDNALVWVVRMGGDFNDPANPGANSDAGRQVAVDGGGNVYVVGDFKGTAQLGPFTRTSLGESDGFAAKLDPSGQVLWANAWGSAESEFGKGLGVDASGNVYAQLGYYGSDATTADRGMEIVKFNSAGATMWSRWFNTKTGAYNQIAVDSAGNTIAFGSFIGTVDFDPGPKTKWVSAGPNTGAYLLKLTTNGDLGWVKELRTQTSSDLITPGAITLDPSGNIVVGGNYRNAVDFKPGSGTVTLPSQGGGFLARYSSSGSLAWARALVVADGTSSMGLTGLATDASGNILATGNFTGTIDFDPGAGTAHRTSSLNSNGTHGSDVYVMKLTAAGSFAWAETFVGSGGFSTGYGLGVDATGTVTVVGLFANTVDFNPDPSQQFLMTGPSGRRSLFLAKLRQR